MTSPWTTGRIADLVGASCEGPRDRVIRGVASLEVAGPEELAFCTGGRWAVQLGHTRAGAVLMATGSPPSPTVALVHPDPRLAFAMAASALVPGAWPEPGVHPTAVLHPSARVAGATVDAGVVVEAGAVVGKGTWLMAQSYLGRGVRLGERCRIGPHAVVMDGCQLGDGVRLQPGAVVGSDGFGHAPGPDGPVRMPRLGSVEIGDDVEVGANATVDRGSLGPTRLGAHSRLDNLVQVAHGVQVGARCLLAAFVGLAGGARLGDDVHMGGRAAVVDGVRVGDGARFAALASAVRDVEPGAELGGQPARSKRAWLREVAALRHLPALLARVDRLERRLAGSDPVAAPDPDR